MLIIRKINYVVLIKQIKIQYIISTTARILNPVKRPSLYFVNNRVLYFMAIYLVVRTKSEEKSD